MDNEPPVTSAAPGQGSVIKPAAFTPASGKAKKRRIAVKPVAVALGTLLLICAAIAWFLFTARSVLINTQPPGADIALSGKLTFRLGEHYLLRPGSAGLSLSAPGYHPLETELQISTEQNQTFDFSLEKLPGHLTITTSPVTAARVLIDGRELGEAGSKLLDISAGEHLLEVVAERYRPHRQTIVIEGLDIHQQLALTLQPAWAEVSVDSRPAGAQLLVDGEAAGLTPLTAEILEGERDIIVKLAGYKAWQTTLEISAGEPLALPPIALEKADGLVMLTSRPQGAGVTVDGQYRGQTPLELALPPGANYQLTLYKDGFEPAQRRLAVVSGEDQNVNIALQAQLGQVDVRSRHSDALVYIDGRLMGRANQVFSLPARRHQVVVKKDGFVDYRTQVLPRPGLEQVVQVSLKTVEQAKWENIQTRITSPAGQVLKLFKPQQDFTMGASRREQGRRANENLRQVSLTRPFYLGLTEVTNAEFRKFSKFHSSGHAKGNSLDNNKHPVVNISWQQAALYCNWLSQQEGLAPFYTLEKGKVSGFNPESTGYRLPTEAEWAWVARYRQGGMLKYPWGPTLDPPPRAGNYADRSAAALLGNILVNYDDGFAVTAPVGSFSADAMGLYDIGGNAAEWINDFYGISTGLSRKREVDPMGPPEGDFRVIRGASWAHGTVTDLRLSFRDYGVEARNDVGFRVARFVE